MLWSQSSLQAASESIPPSLNKEQLPQLKPVVITLLLLTSM